MGLADTVRQTRGDAGESVGGQGRDAAVHGDGDLQRREHAEPDGAGDLDVGNSYVATIAAGSLATAVAVGTSNITASLNGVTSSADLLTVTAATLQSIAVTPASPSVAKGGTQQFTATGTYSDASTHWFFNSSKLFSASPRSR